MTSTAPSTDVERVPDKPQEAQQNLSSIQAAKPPEQGYNPTRTPSAPCLNNSSCTQTPALSAKPFENGKPIEESLASTIEKPAPHTQSAQQQQPSVPPTKTNTKPTEKPIVPPVGSRIEVLWKIDYGADADDKMEVDTATEENTVTRWWGATVQDRLKEALGSRRPDQAERQLHVLLYDAYQEFAEDTATVAFISADTLVDLSQLEDVNKGELQWRFEDSAQKQTDSAQDEKSQLVSLEEYAADLSAAVQDAGLTEETDLQILSTLPLHVQSRFATGYRRFADTLKNSLDKFLQEKPEDYVVTKADVQKVFASIYSHPP
ncbi:hypothetical protein BWQ96_06185 [Gracilariopsis chorda]|uniref:Uncharacterized protein n=1 Tax=Gracilariopsis chorda TaxID=448386 RepID=A0A2V3IPW1_9FLOR|nr:hypothetical protein BWQ96_06185 [Gracilariopsis chorda]|eukprot:PXF44104.1 hypothetical protein BWQ96_06185 [Gracilariopsis chorda]